MFSPITDGMFLREIEEMEPNSGWGLWEVEITYEDGFTAGGTIQGDGINYDPESFVEE